MRNWAVIVWIIALCTGLLSNLLFFGVLDYKYIGTYQFGRVVIYPDKTVNLDEYLGVARHEWAHYYMDKLAPKGFLAAWKNVVKVCGLETEYAKSYRSKAVQLEEEWAECSRLGTCCSLKMSLVNVSVRS